MVNKIPKAEVSHPNKMGSKSQRPPEQYRQNGKRAWRTAASNGGPPDIWEPPPRWEVSVQEDFPPSSGAPEETTDHSGLLSGSCSDPRQCIHLQVKNTDFLICPELCNGLLFSSEGKLRNTAFCGVTITLLLNSKRWGGYSKKLKENKQGHSFYSV